MSKALNDLKGALSNAGDYIDALEVELEDLDQYNDLFDDVYEARDCKDYCEEMRDLFDDVYDAQRAKDFLEAAEYAGLDDADLENVAYELEEYQKLGDIDEVREAVESSDGGVRVADLEKQVEELKAQNEKLYAEVQNAIKLEDQRCAAIYALGGITLEQHEIDKTAGEEQAYEVGLNDGLIIRKQIDHPAGVPLDIIIAPEEDGNE